MAMRTVADVMTAGVITVGPETRYQHIVNLLIEYGISAVPVVDEAEYVLGVVSEGDLATKVEFAAAEPLEHDRSQDDESRQKAATKAHADSASELMTSPAVTISGDATVAAAARAMADADVKRLPVVSSEGRLIGIVSRRDLLRIHLRGDVEIRTEISDLLEGWFRPQRQQIKVAVTDGVVTLTGDAQDRRQAEHAVLLASSIDGVVNVVDNLASGDAAAAQ
jgi:CBS-domain-containing membrane protein